MNRQQIQNCVRVEVAEPHRLAFDERIRFVRPNLGFAEEMQVSLAAIGITRHPRQACQYLRHGAVIEAKRYLAFNIAHCGQVNLRPVRQFREQLRQTRIAGRD